jgi:hypothetical protein
MTQAELQDRFSFVERMALCVVAACFLIVAGIAYGIAWIFAPECNCE